MSDGYIIRRGSGGGKLYAAIAVTYPTGNICICTNGIKTLTAKGTGGSCVFYVPEAGTWTVSCTDGTETASKTVVISSKYQAVVVNLNFFPVYELGDYHGFSWEERTFGTASTNEHLIYGKAAPNDLSVKSDSSTTGWKSGCLVTTTEINTVGKTALVLKPSVSRSNKGNVIYLFLTTSSSGNPYTEMAASAKFGSTADDVEIDISSTQGLYRVGIGVFENGNTSSDIELKPGEIIVR